MTSKNSKGNSLFSFKKKMKFFFRFAFGWAALQYFIASILFIMELQVEEIQLENDEEKRKKKLEHCYIILSYLILLPNIEVV